MGVGFKTKFGLILGKKNREGQEEEKGKRKKKMEEPRKVWKLTLSMEIMKISTDRWNFCIDFYGFWYGSLEICMDTCLGVVSCKKPNPRINSYGIKSMESFL